MTRSKKATGYLINIENPGFSGIATATFCSRKPRFNQAPGDEKGRKWTPRGSITTAYVEGGFGVRQLAAVLGSNFEQAGAHTKLDFIIDEYGMLASFQPTDSHSEE